MFREMRRKRQLLNAEETEAIVNSGTHGTIALMGDEGYPYAVPVSYAYENGVFYFHGAKTGHKPDAVKNCGKASICIVAEDNIIPEKYTTYFKSVIAFGKISIITDAQEAREAAEKIGRRYNPKGTEEELRREVEKELPALCAMKLEVEHMTGKQAIELVKK